MSFPLRLTALCALSASVCAADPVGFYSGVGVGVYEIDRDGFEDTSPAAKLFAGYSFDQYLAIEGAYVGLAGAEDTVMDVPIRVDGEGWEISGKLSYPVTERFSAYGRLGWAYYEFDGRFGTGDDRLTDEAEEDDFVFAVGGSYALTRQLGAAAEFSRADLPGADIDQLSLTVRYSF